MPFNGTKSGFFSTTLLGLDGIRLYKIPGDDGGIGPLDADLEITYNVAIPTNLNIFLNGVQLVNNAGPINQQSLSFSFVSDNDANTLYTLGITISGNPIFGPSQVNVSAIGLWNSVIRIEFIDLVTEHNLQTILNFQSLNEDDFTFSLIDPPIDLVYNPITEFISWTPQAPGNSVVLKGTEIIGSVPEGVNEFFIDEPGEYTVKTFTNNPNLIGPPSEPLGPNFPIEIISSGGIDLGGNAELVFLVDPSGIYTLVPNKFNDTLYDRYGMSQVTTVVSIPDPFIKTAFVRMKR